MKKAQYLALMAWTRQTPRRAFFCELVCRALPAAAAAVYLAAAVWLLVTRSPALVRYAAVPALTLAAVSLLRRLIGRPRPYERWPEATPLMRARRRGQGCPSRHAASALALALAGFTVHPALGTGLLAAALGIGATRVAAGVHFIGDVLAGYALAALCGIGLFIGQV